MRLVDADALLETFTIVAKKMARSDAQKALMGRVLYLLEHKPEVVARCEHCKHCKMVVDIIGDPHLFCGLSSNNAAVQFGDFCSYGERKEATP